MGSKPCPAGCSCTARGERKSRVPLREGGRVLPGEAQPFEGVIPQHGTAATAETELQPGFERSSTGSRTCAPARLPRLPAAARAAGGEDRGPANGHRGAASARRRGGEMSIRRRTNWCETVPWQLVAAEERDRACHPQGDPRAAGFVNNVGLEYLRWSANAGTLSGGESQRSGWRARSAPASRGCSYVLDEPSIGLHQRDNDRLLDTLKNLRDQGNTGDLVEHMRSDTRGPLSLSTSAPAAGRARRAHRGPWHP